MDFKDYYAILGVAKDAEDKVIKKAYQKLAKQYHPDVNPNNKQAEEKFKEISEAYQAISDPEKRRKYDELKENYEVWKKRGGNASGNGDFDWNRWQARPDEGTQGRTMSPEEFAGIFGDRGFGGRGSSGAGDFSDFFSTIFGGEDTLGQPRGRRAARAQAGRDLELEVSVTLEEAYHGTTRLIDTDEKRIQAKIPKGVRTGSKVRLTGQGGAGFGGGTSGDLYLLITVEMNSSFLREGDDLSTEVPVDFYTAVLGGEVSVKTLNGEVLIKIPSKIQSKAKLRLKGKGMPRLEYPSQAGDLYAQILIVLPNHIDAEEINSLQLLAERYHDRTSTGNINIVNQ